MKLIAVALLKVQSAMNAEGSSFLAVEEDTKELVFVVVHGAVPEDALEWRRMPMSQGIAGWVSRELRPATVNNVKADDRFFSDLDQEISFKTRSIVAAPLVSDGRLLGVIEIVNKRDGKLFTLRDESMLWILAHLSAGLLANIIGTADPAATFVGMPKPGQG